jgi:hypothetical protein
MSKSNNLLREMPTNHKKLLTEYNRIPTQIPFQMNQTRNGKYILFAHGNTQAGYSFKIPKNINFITLTRVNYTCDINPMMDQLLLDFYRRGKTIFENNDLGKELTEAGTQLLKYIQQHFSETIDFKNHLGNEIANEMFLSFSSSGEGQQKSLGILDLENKSSSIKNMKNVISLYSNSKNRKINQILLSSLLTMYDNQSSKIKKTFIICACRGFNSESSNNNKAVARAISGYSNNRTSRPGYLSNNQFSS